MNPLTLAQEIIDGRRITREDDLSFFLTCDLDELCEGADRIREACIGDKVDLCSIINGRSGRCPEDCKYCAQSAHHHTSCEVYNFLPEEKILEACKMNESEGVDRFSIVTAGKALTGKEFDQAIHAYETMHRECKIDLCASMGFISAEQLHRLHEAGVTSYHHNIETSRRNFPNICTTHTYDMKIETLKKVKAEGMLDDDTHVLHTLCNTVHIIIITILAPLLFAPYLNSVEVSGEHNVFFQTSEFP